jgi:hypothetical protein
MNESMIIGLGTERDPASLHLYTTLNRTRIENVRPPEELCFEGLQAAYKHVRSVSPSAKCRSLTAMYNCVGMVFASRRTSIEATHIELILRDDGFYRVRRENVWEGDVVVYRRDNLPQHVGVVYQLDRRVDEARAISEIWVLSQWGDCGEYIHKIAEVPTAYGSVTEFWSERKPA